MMTLAVVFALAVGWLTGGRLRRWEKARLRFLPLPVAALLLQQLLGRLSQDWAPALILLSYGLLFLFCLANCHLPKTALLAALGAGCNLLVIALNGFRMPVSRQAASVLSSEGLAALESLQIPMYALAGPDTRLWLLGDILYVPFLRGFASIGDLLLAAGVFFCLMAVMAPTSLPRWIRRG